MRKSATPLSKRALLELTISGRERALASLPSRSKAATEIKAELKDLRARLAQTPAPEGA